MAALGVAVWSMDRYEADDALASAARRWRDQVAQVRILTPDKDLGQCVTGNRVVQVDRMRRRVIDEDSVWAKHGCAPASIPDWLALVGDTADGIPGVPGFGAKTAAALLAEYGTVEAIPARSAHWNVKLRGAMRLAARLQEMRPAVALYKALATLAEDVPLAESLDDLRWRGADRGAFERLAREVGGLAMRPSRYRDRLARIVAPRLQRALRQLVYRPAQQTYRRLVPSPTPARPGCALDAATTTAAASGGSASRPNRLASSAITVRVSTTKSEQLKARPATCCAGAVSNSQTAAATSSPCTSVASRAGGSGSPRSTAIARSNHLLRSAGWVMP